MYIYLWFRSVDYYSVRKLYDYKQTTIIKDYLQHGINHQLVQKRKTMVLYPHMFSIYLSSPLFFKFMPSRNLLYRTKFTRHPHHSNTMPAVAILILRWTTDGKVAVSNPTSGMDGCTSGGKEFKDVFGFPDPYRDIPSTWVFGRM